MIGHLGKNFIKFGPRWPLNKITKVRKIETYMHWCDNGHEYRDTDENRNSRRRCNTAALKAENTSTATLI